MGIEVVDANGNITLKYKTSKYYYHNNEQFRERAKTMMRENYRRRKAENPEKERERLRDLNRNKYQNDPEYREKKKADNRARSQAKRLAKLNASA